MAKWADFEIGSVGAKDRIKDLEDEVDYLRVDSAAAWDKCEEYMNKLIKAEAKISKLRKVLDD